MRRRFRFGNATSGGAPEAGAGDDGPNEEDTRALIQTAYRYALSLTASPADAEDLVQEAWMRLLRRYGRVNRPPPP